MGKYIIFSDQDDCYCDKNSIYNMYRAIKEDGTEIVQFGYWKNYFGGVKRKVVLTDKKYILDKETFCQKEIAGVLGMSGTMFTPSVWTKIYKADILKQAIENISETLYISEDCYLNCITFFSSDVKSVSVRPEAYYVWNIGVGFSASRNSGEILFDELKMLKPLQVSLLRNNKCNEEIIFMCHLEVLYFLKTLISHMIEEKRDKNSVVEKIIELNKYEIVNEAKLYFKNQTLKPIWDELEFMISDLTPIEYYNWCEQKVPRWNIKKIVKKIIRICK